MARQYLRRCTDSIFAKSVLSGTFPFGSLEMNSADGQITTVLSMFAAAWRRHGSFLSNQPGIRRSKKCGKSVRRSSTLVGKSRW